LIQVPVRAFIFRSDHLPSWFALFIEDMPVNSTIPSIAENLQSVADRRSQRGEK
jgi:hypothetical protein